MPVDGLVTVSVSNIIFLHSPTSAIRCYTEVKRVGRSSITLDVAVWVLRQGQRRAGQGERVKASGSRRAGQGERVKATEAEFTFVAIDGDGRPRALRAARPQRAQSRT